ncbi:contractile injection system protein, VgrG/Pvc8 family, partial [Helicobacter trogontum]|uniref:type VI secretion system Vgr family protein n=1 Tax=Helicobacter trogontum TaxID=50960 RepID=UPI002A914C49
LEVNSNNSNISLQPKDFLNCLATLNIYHSPHNKDSKIIYFDHSYSNMQTTTYKGIITHLQYLGSFQQNTTNTLTYRHNFTLTLQSPLLRLSLNTAYRIYTNITPIDAIKHTLRFYEGYLEKTLDFSQIIQTYNTQEIISQYNESDLEFMTRIAHNHGIYFYEDANTIYFCDSLTTKPTKNIAYNPHVIANALQEECIHHFSKEENLHSNSFTYSSHDANAPIDIFSSQIYTYQDEETEQPDNTLTSFTHTYDSSSSFTQSIDTRKPLHLKAKRLQMLDATLKAQSNIYHLGLADFLQIDYEKYKYANNDNTLLNKHKEFIIVAIEQTLIDNALLTQYSTTQGDVAHTTTSNSHDNESITSSSKNQNGFTRSYSNTLKLMPSHMLYVPDTKAKPKAPLHTQGIVIGEGYLRAPTQEQANQTILQEHNTIYTDEYGRVKVRMNIYANQEKRDNALLERIQKDKHYLQDNPNTTNESNSTNQTRTNQENNTYKMRYSYTSFLRVASPIASNSSGFYHTPRIADEVIISFLDNDIDKPFISGSLYNTTNPIPSALPKQDHITTLSSKTIGAQEYGYNQLCFSNLKDNEEISLKAQKDYTQSINNNFSQTIKNNKDSTTLGNYTESIHKAHMQTITLAKNVNIGGEYLTNVALSKDTIVGLSNSLNVGASHSLRVAKESSESIGGDRRVEIGGSENTTIEKDSHTKIKGNSETIIEGDKQEYIEGELHIASESNSNIRTQKNLYLESDSLSLESKTLTHIQADSLGINTQTTIHANASDEATIQVGETTIIAKNDSIILKAGGVEVIIDSKGLIVKGGEVKSE